MPGASRPFRVGYVLERYPELSQTFVEDELRALARQGAVPEVMALAPGAHAGLTDARFTPHYPPGAAARLAALAALAARQPRGVGRLLRRPGRWPSDGRHVRGVARLAPWVSVCRGVDHVHAQFASGAADIAALLAALAGKTHSFTGHSTDLFADPAGLIARLTAADLVVLVCEYDRREVERLAPGVGRIEVVPLGVDLERLRRRRPYTADGPIVAVGRLVPQKGFDDLVAVAGELGAPVALVGDGPLRGELEARAAGRVQFTGAVPRDGVAALIEGASVLVAPSVVAADGSRDGIPMVVKEAMALAVPVVASDAVGNPEVVDSQSGALYGAGDRRALREALQALLARPAGEREAMGRAGREFVEREADVQRQTAVLADLLERTARIAGPPGPPGSPGAPRSPGPQGASGHELPRTQDSVPMEHEPGAGA
jgi:glycosyltransferase involved in cell wall biosynthesis